jgi:hypothetical protein
VKIIYDQRAANRKKTIKIVKPENFTMWIWALIIIATILSMIK